jgi:hypothetical protein
MWPARGGGGDQSREVRCRQLGAAALREGRILPTLDKGIASLIQHPVNNHAGVVLFRPGASGRSAVLDSIRSHLAELLFLELANRVTVIS